ncbi:hypothetical protein BC826DRAFT_973590 [Russula brevipes]|nr:hypothetical protein BC826DRAFT_973590 [Russula brevipes]
MAAPIVSEAVLSWLLLPWEPAHIVPTVCDAPAFGQPARSAIQHGPHALHADCWHGYVVAVPTLGAPCACCAAVRDAIVFVTGQGSGGTLSTGMVVAGAAMVWVTEATVVVWAACSSGSGDVDSAAGRQRWGRQEKRRPSPNDRGLLSSNEGERLMGGSGDLAMAWNEAKKNGKEGGGAQVGGRSECADVPWSKGFSMQCHCTFLTTPARHEEEEGSGQQATVGQPTAYPHTMVRVMVCHGVAESNTTPAPVTPMTVTPRENPHP